MFIYGLFDPHTNELRYIGKTCKSLSERLSGHIQDNSKCYKTNWLKSLGGKKPLIELLDDVNDNEWEFWERWYIAYFRGLGCRLTNTTNGGEKEARKGLKMSDEAKAKISKALIGNKHGVGNSNRRGKKMSAASRKLIGDVQRKFNKEQVKEIRNLKNQGLFDRQIAEKYSVSRQCIQRLLSGKRGYNLL